MEIQGISTLLQKCVLADDVVGTRRLLVEVDEQDRKLIVAKKDNCNAPLFVAAKQGNVDMVNFLVKECLADKEELGRYENQLFGSCHLVTPLWCAAVSGKLEVVKLLIDLGADINAASDTGITPVLCASGNMDIAKFLIKHGADVRKPTHDGETCLMNAVHLCNELCQILIDNGAEVNAQNSSGNSALHLAIIDCNNILEKGSIVQLLIDHGSNPYMKNKNGDDAFQMASLEGLNWILEILLRKFNPPARRWIESYELLGAYFVHGDPPLRHWTEACDYEMFGAAVHRRPIDIKTAMCYWMKAFDLRRNSPFDVIAVQPSPVYGFTKEVNTVEELQTLSRNRDNVCMHALIISERILGRDHHQILPRLLFCSTMLEEDHEFRRCIDIMRYAFQLNYACVEQMTTRELHMRFLCPLYHLCFAFCKATRALNNFVVEFEEVFEVLQKVTSKIDDATGIVLTQEFQKSKHSQLTFMKIILHLVKLVTELDKNEDQDLRFKKVIHRLVRCQPKTHMGQTLLHLSVSQSTSNIDGKFFSQFPSIAVVKLLLECGANVNAVDYEHNTALYSYLEANRYLELSQCLYWMKHIIELFLENEAHVDMISLSRDSAAAEVLTSSLTEMNIQQFDSLKCLAATAVVKYKILYIGHISTSLESFVQMHGR